MRISDWSSDVCSSDLDLAAVGLCLAGDGLEQGRFAGTVRPDHADDAAGRQVEIEILEQQFVAVSLGQPLGLDDVVAEPFGDLDQDLRLADRAVLLRSEELRVGQECVSTGRYRW